MGNYDDREYEIGKGKPPKHSQFKKGQTGNEKGPPRKRRDSSRQNVTRRVQTELVTTVSVTIEGQMTKMTKSEAMIRKAANDAFTGTPTHTLKVMNLFANLGVFYPDPKDMAASFEPRLEFLEGLTEATKDYEAPRYEPQTGP
ncbi:MAG: DUF5681 domain-containing protein [Pontixanthobacter sp.]